MFCKLTKMRYPLLVICFCIGAASCNKKDYPIFSDLEIDIELVNKEGQVTNWFMPGDDITFRYVIRNLSDKVIPYSGSPCPQYHFTVFRGNQLIGDPQPDGSACPEELLSSVLDPGEADYYMINWFEDTSNPQLTTAEYKVKFHAVISLQEGKLIREIEKELDLEIR